MPVCNIYLRRFCVILDMEIPDLLQPLWFAIALVVLFIIITGRYFLVAGFFYVFFHRLRKNSWKSRKLSVKGYKQDQFRKEITWSMVTAFIFSVAGVFTVILWQQGATKIYLNVNDLPLWYLPVSLVTSMLLHETYYYFLHRWMHRPSIFKLVHRVHHDSNITSPWTAFSFHPLEGLIQAIFLPVLICILPLHPGVILFQLTLMTISSVINHLDIEIYPKNFHRHLLGKWLIGASHHALHHRQFKFNFGLYFTFWDKLKKTESPAYPQLFESSTTGESANRQRENKYQEQ
jgi:Delta7-sterol 5-desaturase